MPRRSRTLALVLAFMCAAVATAGRPPRAPRGMKAGFRPIWDGAHAGEPLAMFKLGRALIYGHTKGRPKGRMTQSRMEVSYHGLKKNTAKGYEWVEKAVAAGDPLAATYLAGQVEFGFGVPKNPSRARKLYEQGAAGGNEVARKWLLSHGYTERMIARLGAPSREDRVATLRQKAATGDPKATLELAVALTKGDGADKDMEEAARLFEKAASLDHGEGHAWLARQAEKAGKPEEAIGHWIRARDARTWVYIGGAQQEIDRIRAAHPRGYTRVAKTMWVPPPRRTVSAAASAIDEAFARVDAWQAAREQRTLDGRRDFNSYQRQTGGKYRYTDGGGRELY